MELTGAHFRASATGSPRASATVKVEGEKITVESCDKELAGKIASDIELLTSKSNRDLRVFQDGIYMIEKANEVLGVQ